MHLKLTIELHSDLCYIKVIFSFATSNLFSFFCRVMKSIDDVLHLSQRFGMTVSEPGILVVEFIFSIVWQLLDATLDDEGLLELTLEKRSAWAAKSQEMEIDYHDSYDEKRAEFKERLQNVNTVMAIELIGQFLQNKVTSRIIYLARRNMYVHSHL